MPVHSTTLTNVPYAVGATVPAYKDYGQQPRDAPSGPPVTSAVVAANSSLTYSGIEPGFYWAVAQVDGAWRWTAFDIPGPTEEDLFAHEQRTTDVHGIPDTGLLVDAAALAASQADTTNVHGIADTTRLALKASADDRIRYVSTTGSDANDGLCWGTAFLTIGKAVADLGNRGGVYISCGTFQETVVPGPGMRFVGSANGSIAGDEATCIQAPDDASDCVDISNVSNVSLENIHLRPSGPNWNGTMLNIDHGSQIRGSNILFYNDWRAQNIGGLPTSSVGGVGLAMTNAEGCLFESGYFAGLRLGLHLINEASDNTFLNTRGAVNYQDLVIEGNSGGNIFSHTKFVNCVSTTPNVVEIGGAAASAADMGNGNNVFIALDVEEGASPNKVLVSSNRNTFINFVGAPQSVLTVSGHHNEFISPNFQRTPTISGTFNRFVHSAGDMVITGANNEALAKVSGNITQTAALKRRVRGADAAAATTLGAVAKKIEVFDEAGTSLGFLPVYDAIT